jgi:DNA polymerase-3 subunit beta
MQITVNQAVFAKNLSIVNRSTGVGGTLPILENILLEIDSDNSCIKATATNLAIFIKATIPAQFDLFENTSTTKSFLINGKQLVDFINTLPSNSEIKLTPNNLNGINLQCNKIKFQFPGMPVEQFPNVSEIPEPAKSSILFVPGEKLKDGLKQTLYIPDPKEVTPFRCSVLMDIFESEIRFVSTDGHRMAIRKIPVTNITKSQIMLPVNSIKKIVDLIIDDSVQLIFNEQKLFIISPDTVIGINLVAGNYPKYESVFNNGLAGNLLDNNNISQISINADVLEKALRRASSIDDRALFIFKGDSSSINISGKSTEGDLRTSDEDLDLIKNSEIGFEEVFNVKYMADYLKNIDTDNVRLIYQKVKNKAVLIESGNKEDGVYQYLIMPIIVNKGVA